MFLDHDNGDCYGLWRGLRTDEASDVLWCTGCSATHPRTPTTIPLAARENEMDFLLERTSAMGASA